MIDTLALRAIVSAVLEDEIGTYTFITDLGSQTTPAIRVEELYEQEPTVEGLEVVIQAETSIAITPFLAGDKQLDFGIQITLKQWDIAKTTQSAREILLKQLDVEQVQIVPRSTRLDNIETCTLTLSDSFCLFG